VVASHPIYQYFARRYKIEIKSFLLEPEITIDQKHRKKIKLFVNQSSAKIMIWEDDPSENNRAITASMGLKNISIKPCMNRPSEGDFLTVMRENVSVLAKAYN
jgi:zinc transport system substrate-binding protein